MYVVIVLECLTFILVHKLCRKIVNRLLFMDRLSITVFAGNGNLSQKKRAFDNAMLVNRFHEEISIVVVEMHRHINSLELQLDRLKSLLQDNCK